MGKTAILAVKIIGDAKGAVSSMGEVEGKAGRMGSVLGGIGKAAVAGLAAGAVAVVGFGLSAISSASDLEQSIGAIDTVFKGSAGQMSTWADQAATSVGLTKTEYNNLGTLIGTQLKNGGTAMEDLAPKTNDLIGLGADLASMFGGTTADAVGALSSALKGERDPIEKYGVSLTQASIDAKAAELGFSKVGGSLSAEATQAATLALIMDQTADAHGNFAKEADTVQGQQARLTASLNNTKDAIGMALLPAVSTLLGLFNTSLMPIITDAAAAFTTFMASVDVGPALTGLMTGLAPAGEALLHLGSSLTPLLPLAGELLTNGIMPLVSGLAAGLGPVIVAIADVFIPPLIGALSTIIPAVVPVLAAIGEFASALGSTLAPIITGLAPLVSGVFAAISGSVSAGLAIVTGIVTAATALLRGDWSGAWSAIQSTVAGAWSTITGLVSSGVASARAAIAAGVSGFLSAGTALVQGLVSGITAGISWVVDAARNLASSAVNAAKSALGIASPSRIFKTIGQNTGQGLVSGLDSMTGAVSRAGDRLAGAAIPSTPTIPLTARTLAAGPASASLDAAGIVININGGMITPDTLHDLTTSLIAALNDRARRLGITPANQVVMV